MIFLSDVIAQNMSDQNQQRCNRQKKQWFYGHIR